MTFKLEQPKLTKKFLTEITVSKSEKSPQNENIPSKDMFIKCLINISKALTN